MKFVMKGEDKEEVKIGLSLVDEGGRITIRGLDSKDNYNYRIGYFDPEKGLVLDTGLSKNFPLEPYSNNGIAVTRKTLL